MTGLKFYYDTSELNYSGKCLAFRGGSSLVLDLERLGVVVRSAKKREGLVFGTFNYQHDGLAGDYLHFSDSQEGRR